VPTADAWPHLTARPSSLLRRLDVLGSRRGDLRVRCPWCHRLTARVLSPSRWRCRYCGEGTRVDLYGGDPLTLAAVEYDEWETAAP
jgi:ribosomal protein L37AE/L43A